MMKVVFAIHHAGAFRSYDGVIRYFKEIGAWTAELETVQAKFLKR